MSPKTRQFYQMDFIRPRRSFKVCQKLAAIRMYERTSNKSIVAARYGVTRSVIYGWLAKKSELLATRNRYVSSNASGG